MALPIIGPTELRRYMQTESDVGLTLDQQQMLEAAVALRGYGLDASQAVLARQLMRYPSLDLTEEQAVFLASTLRLISALADEGQLEFVNEYGDPIVSIGG